MGVGLFVYGKCVCKDVLPVRNFCYDKYYPATVKYYNLIVIHIWSRSGHPLFEDIVTFDVLVFC